MKICLGKLPAKCHGMVFLEVHTSGVKRTSAEVTKIYR